MWPTITKLLREAAVNDVRREGEREGGGCENTCHCTCERGSCYDVRMEGST